MAREVKAGDLVAGLNPMWRGIVPYSTPLIVVSVTPKRIVVEPLPPEGRDKELWSPTRRHFTQADIIDVFPDEATGRARCKAAYDAYSSYVKRIREIEAEASEVIHKSLRGEA